ncbi:hypothetical protein SEA_ZUKO_51 [Streptomyces phage Zuko]|uniref:Uncharacterized protein n=1 Tax=Streptomyces phage Zuko TaxID=2601695 RepID=A0A5J6D755_9CAUD|nr:hypothetical protein PP630_gp051 [Streptomyces phage Zuko]QEQ93629.1 hypothetical protein SEA_ZUKO_51 [Streptomyces phage Zuko]
MEVPTGDDEDSPCIGADTTPEVTVVQADVSDKDAPYPPRWE